MHLDIKAVSDKMISLPLLMVNVNDLPKSILDDISDATSLNNVKLSEYEPLDRLIDIYLQWKGIHGFSSDIIEMIKQSFQAKITVKEELENAS